MVKPMKTGGTNNEFPLPDILLAEVQAAAEEEHRPTSDIVREAVERYLKQRHASANTSVAKNGETEKGLAAAARIRELRKGNLLPAGVTIRDLINEGRA